MPARTVRRRFTGRLSPGRSHTKAPPGRQRHEVVRESGVAEAFQIRSLHGGAITVVDARSARTFARHSHEEFGVGLLSRGAQRSWSGRGAVEAGAGQVITVNPAETHDGAPIGEERAWSMLYVAPALVGSVVEDLSEGRLGTRELHAPVVDDVRTARLFGAARAAVLRDARGGALAERLLLLFAALFKPAPASTRSTPGRVARVRERLDDDPAKPHHLAELAALAGLSRFQLLRAFAQATGLTPHVYLVQRRLEVARQLMRGGATLADAAAAAGFADQSHLNRAFRGRYGYTPGAYRRALSR